MTYYIVGILDKESYKIIEDFQKYISYKYNLYSSLPKLHITLEVVENPDLNTLKEELNNILNQTAKFPIVFNGAICFDPPYKSVNLKVKKQGVVYELSKKLNLTLNEKGFKVRKDFNNWELHVSIANTNYSKRDWSYNEYKTACEFLKNKNFEYTATIEKIQLWKPINDEKQMVIMEFPLLSI